jgi:hypothetical protein
MNKIATTLIVKNMMNINICPEDKNKIGVDHVSMKNTIAIASKASPTMIKNMGTPRGMPFVKLIVDHYHS